MLKFNSDIVDEFIKACELQLLEVEYNEKNKTIIVSRVEHKDNDIKHITNCEISLIPFWTKSFMQNYSKYIFNCIPLFCDFFELYKWTKETFMLYKEIDIDNFNYIE